MRLGMNAPKAVARGEYAKAVRTIEEIIEVFYFTGL